LLALWAGPAAVAQGQAPIRIGAALSLTGAYETLGRMFHRGYQLCVRRANEDGGILGRTLELLVEDDRSEAAAAVRVYERLITQTRVEAILGPYSSPITVAAADVAEIRGLVTPAHRPLLAPSHALRPRDIAREATPKRPPGQELHPAPRPDEHGRRIRSDTSPHCSRAHRKMRTLLAVTSPAPHEPGLPPPPRGAMIAPLGTLGTAGL
jgi:hypothetical protein